MRVLFIILVTCGIVSFSCVHDSAGEREKHVKELLRKSNDLSGRYLNGNIEEARGYLLADTKLLENTDLLEPIGRAQLLAFDYFRLFKFEKFAGRQEEAAIDLIKAQYWSIKNGELEHIEPKTIFQDIKKFDTTTIEDYVTRRDRGLNGGRDPKYIHDLALGAGGK
jgi:hypothetical protein